MDAETIREICSTMLRDGEKPANIVRSLLDLGADREQAESIVGQLSAEDDEATRKSKRLKEAESALKSERSGKRAQIEDLPDNVLREIVSFLPTLASVLQFARASPLLRSRILEFVVAEGPHTAARLVPASLGADQPPPPPEQDDFADKAALRLYRKKGDPPTLACILEARAMLYGLSMRSPANDRFARRLVDSYPLVQMLDLEDVVPLRRSTFEAMGAALPSLRRVALKEMGQPPKTREGWFESMVRRGGGSPAPSQGDYSSALQSYRTLRDTDCPWLEDLRFWARSNAGLVFDTAQGDPAAVERDFEFGPRPRSRYRVPIRREPPPRFTPEPDADYAHGPPFTFLGPLQVQSRSLRRLRLAGDPRCADVLACLARSCPALEDIDIAVSPEASCPVDWEVARLYGGVREADCVAGVLEACPLLEELDVAGAAAWLPYRLFRLGDSSPRLRKLRVALHRPCLALRAATEAAQGDSHLHVVLPPPFPAAPDPGRVWMQPAGIALARLGASQAAAEGSARAFAASLAACPRLEEVSFAGSSETLGLHRALRALRAGAPECPLLALDLSRCKMIPDTERHCEDPELLQPFTAGDGRALRAAGLAGPRLRRLALRRVGEVDLGQMRGAGGPGAALVALDVSDCQLRTQGLDWRGLACLTELDIADASFVEGAAGERALLGPEAVATHSLVALRADGLRPSEGDLVPRLLDRSARTLRTLSLSDILPGDVPAWALRRLAGGVCALEAFRMLRSTAIEASWLRPLLYAAGPTLRALELGAPDLRAPGGVSDEDLRCIAACCTALRSLTLDAMRDVSASGLFEFVETCGPLRRLAVLDVPLLGWTVERHELFRRACAARAVELEFSVSSSY
eukprot:tig00000204_g17693.t1